MILPESIAIVMLIQIKSPTVFVSQFKNSVAIKPNVNPNNRPTKLNKRYIMYLLFIKVFLETGVVITVFNQPDVLSILIVDVTFIPNITVANTVSTHGVTR